jgi:hypothetical protein
MSFVDPVTGLRTPTSAVQPSTWPQFGYTPPTPVADQLAASVQNMSYPVSQPVGVGTAQLGNLYGSANGIAPELGAIPGAGASALPTGAGVGANEMANLYNVGGTAAGDAGILSSLANMFGGGGGANWSSGMPWNAPKILGGPGKEALAEAGASEVPLMGLVGPPIAGWTARNLIQGIGGPKTTGAGGAVKDILGDALAGAGTAAPVGFLGGPFSEISVPVAAGAGFVTGGIEGAVRHFFGGNQGGAPAAPSDDDLRKSLSDAATQAGLTPSDYVNQFNLQTKVGMTDSQGNKLSNQQIAGTLASQLVQDAQTQKQINYYNQQQAAQRQADSQFALALQTQARDFMTPYINNIMTSGASQAAVLNNLADQMPASYQDIFRGQAAQALGTATQTASAYANQAMLMPAQVAMASSDQAMQNSLATQQKLYQYAASLAQRQGSGAGATNFSNLAAQSQIPAR